MDPQFIAYAAYAAYAAAAADAAAERPSGDHWLGLLGNLVSSMNGQRDTTYNASP